MHTANHMADDFCFVSYDTLLRIPNEETNFRYGFSHIETILEEKTINDVIGPAGTSRNALVAKFY
uniref:Uncharacterized protein n=1 Tax=Romanomermis culicivorax TaxID=13658 RepID=A0A915KN65_ROMCU